MTEITTFLATTNGKLIVFGSLAGFFLLLIIFTRGKNSPVKKITSIPFPVPWKKLLTGKYQYYRNLNVRDKEKLENSIQVFLSKKDFYGIDNLEITDEIRLLVAAQACTLIFKIDQKLECYPNHKSIYLYPDKFPPDYYSGIMVDGLSAPPWYDSESVISGEVHLSWPDVSRGIEDGKDGYNPVFYQFARQLDQDDFSDDGIPSLYLDNPEKWIGIFSSYFQKFQTSINSGKSSLINPHAANSLAEFFAATTELFFEVPVQFRKEFPGLYNELKDFYKQDPAYIVSISKNK
ncbi:MAG: zinc-dependent peptidase [Deltaproteobacteria bacterium]|nr:zinc-dependent peptidase [Deltaproteobacteria bacterium]